MPLVVRSEKDHETAAAYPLWRCEDVVELPRMGQSARWRKALSLTVIGLRATHPDRQQGVRRTRPFARRALRTLRPPRVAERARKPWVRARLRRLG